MLDKANPTTYIGAATMVFGGLSLNDWAIISGIILGLSGFIVNFWYKRKMLSIEEEKLEREFPQD